MLIEKSVDKVLGIWTRDYSMVGADETTAAAPSFDVPKLEFTIIQIIEGRTIGGNEASVWPDNKVTFSIFGHLQQWKLVQ